MNNAPTLKVVIGAALSSGFDSVLSSSTTKIKQIGAAIQGMEKQSISASASLSGLRAQYASLNQSISNHQNILQKRAGYRSQILEMVALGASFAVPINSAMKFESAMADVRKVVDFKAPDGLAKMGDSIKALSREIPLSVEGLAQITAAGGQLGVDEDNLISFTTDVAKMSTAFDMTPDEAGKSMAALSNVLQIPITKLTDLGDAINQISNNSSAAARLIVPALARAGGVAKTFGLTAAQTSALVGTLIAMNKAPEEAGTATNAILAQLQRINTLPPKIQKAFTLLDMTTQQFKDDLNDKTKNVQDTLLNFFERVKAKIPESDRLGFLTTIFGKNYASTVTTIVGSLDEYKRQLKLISNPSEYKGSMEEEFRKRAETTENRL